MIVNHMALPVHTHRTAWERPEVVTALTGRGIDRPGPACDVGLGKEPSFFALACRGSSGCKLGRVAGAKVAIRAGSRSRRIS
jgi:hypothetical protein